MAAHLKHAARSGAARFVMTKAGIEETGIMHPEFTHHREIWRHLGGVSRWDVYGFAADEDIERAGIKDDLTGSAV